MTLVEVGVSESLRTLLLREEERLRELRRELKDVSLPVEVREAFNLREAAKAFEDIEQLVQGDPAAARARLSRYLEQDSSPDAYGSSRIWPPARVASGKLWIWRISGTRIS